jgi:hypothetical protein
LKRLVPVVFTILALLVLAGPVGSAGAVPFAYFPALPPPTQVTREISLPNAARAGVVKLDAKGGGLGDAVSLELDGTKKVRGPLTVTVRIEVSVPPRMTPPEREAIRDLLPNLWQETEKSMNVPSYKTKDGDPIKFAIEPHYREPEEAPHSNYHQISIIDPAQDLKDDPDPNFRSRIYGDAIPNTEKPITGTFSTANLDPFVMGHEMMHVVGLNDAYIDVYKYGKKKIILPTKAMSPIELKAYLKKLKPPVPPPPAGKVFSEGLPGSDPCDMMGKGLHKTCRKLNPKDLEWIESQAGTLVTAEPGELLLNKDKSSQNFGIAFKTIVFAAPGSTTVANGISVYCLDHSRTFPLSQGFDVGPAATQLPGYEGVSKLLRFNSEIQPDLKEEVEGMQAAVWNQTDAFPLSASGTAEQARALMARAGVAEDSTPDLASLEDPNAAAPTTGAVDAAGALLPAVATEPSAPAPSLRLFATQLLNKKLHGSGALTSYLLVGTSGPVEELSLKLERRAGKKWKKVRSLPGRKLASGLVPVKLKLGRLGPGKYRLLTAVSGGVAEQATGTAQFLVKR